MKDRPTLLDHFYMSTQHNNRDSRYYVSHAAQSLHSTTRIIFPLMPTVNRILILTCFIGISAFTFDNDSPMLTSRPG